MISAALPIQSPDLSIRLIPCYMRDREGAGAVTPPLREGTRGTGICYRVGHTIGICYRGHYSFPRSFVDH